VAARFPTPFTVGSITELTSWASHAARITRINEFKNMERFNPDRSWTAVPEEYKKDRNVTPYFLVGLIHQNGEFASESPPVG
jgi:hypothetical protein